MTMETLLRIISFAVILFLLYGIIPTILFRKLSIGMTKKGKKRKTLALTFDDGPNPVYTPQVLDLLKKYNVKATFFVVSEKAKAYPELIKRMSREGHSIGIHHYTHSNSWFLTPFGTKREIEKSSKTIEVITGEKPTFYRPPYGRFNVFTHWFAREYEIVLWSSIFQDWKKSEDQDVLTSRLIDKISDGEIFLLHDDGENPGADSDAPQQMIDALKELIPEMRKRGYRPLSLDEHLRIEEQKRSV